MKKSIKYVVVLCMLTVLLMPATSFAAEKQDFAGQAGLKVSAERLQELCSQFKNLNIEKMDLKAFKSAFDKFTAASNAKCTKAPAAPAKPVTQAKPEAPKAPVKPEAPKAPVKPETPQAPAKPETPQAPAKPEAPANNTAASSQEAQVVDLVNQERAAQGLPALKYNAELSKVAEAKAADLRDRGYFDHNSPTYGSPFDMMKSFGIKYTAAGENIAKGQRTPAAVMDGWMNSPGHRANILNSNFTEIGVGHVTDSNGTNYWVQMFIRP